MFYENINVRISKNIRAEIMLLRKVNKYLPGEHKVNFLCCLDADTYPKAKKVPT